MSLRIYILLSLLGSAQLLAQPQQQYGTPQLSEDEKQAGRDLFKGAVDAAVEGFTYIFGTGKTPAPQDPAAGNAGQTPTPERKPDPNQPQNNEVAGPVVNDQPRLDKGLPTGISAVVFSHLLKPMNPQPATPISGQKIQLFAGSVAQLHTALVQQNADKIGQEQETVLAFLKQNPELIANNPALAQLLAKVKTGEVPVERFAAELGIRMGALNGCFADPEVPSLVRTGNEPGAVEMPLKNCGDLLPGGNAGVVYKVDDPEIKSMVALVNKLTDNQLPQTPIPDPNQLANNQDNQNPDAGAGADPGAGAGKSNGGNGNQGINEQQRLQQLAAQAAAFNSGAQYNSTREPIEPPRQVAQLPQMQIPTFGEPVNQQISEAVMNGLRPYVRSQEEREMYAAQQAELNKTRIEVATAQIKAEQAAAAAQVAAITARRQTDSIGALAVTRVSPRLGSIQGRTVRDAIDAGPKSTRTTANGSAISNYSFAGISGTGGRVGRTGAVASQSAAASAMNAETPDKKMAGMDLARGARRAIAPNRAPASVPQTGGMVTSSPRLTPKNFNPNNYKRAGDA